MSVSVAIKTIIADQMIADLMVSALEGGSNYWIERVEPVYANHEAYSLASVYGPGMMPRTFFAEDEAEPATLDWDNIQTGLQTMADDYASHFAAIIEDNHDAETADVFLQCVLFGEVIYG